MSVITTEPTSLSLDQYCGIKEQHTSITITVSRNTISEEFLEAYSFGECQRPKLAKKNVAG